MQRVRRPARMQMAAALAMQPRTSRIRLTQARVTRVQLPAAGQQLLLLLVGLVQLQGCQLTSCGSRKAPAPSVTGMTGLRRRHRSCGASAPQPQVRRCLPLCALSKLWLSGSVCIAGSLHLDFVACGCTVTAGCAAACFVHFWSAAEILSVGAAVARCCAQARACQELQTDKHACCLAQALVKMGTTLPGKIL